MGSSSISKIKFIKKELYHLVRETIKNPLNTVSSRIGASTPVMPSREAVLHKKKKGGYSIVYHA